MIMTYYILSFVEYYSKRKNEEEIENETEKKWLSYREIIFEAVLPIIIILCMCVSWYMAV